MTCMSAETRVDFVFIFYFSVVRACAFLSRIAKNIVNFQFCASILGTLCASILSPPFGSIFGTVLRFHFLYHYALAELVWNLKCSRRGSQATGSNVVFCGLGDLGMAIFLKLEGNIISTLFNLHWVPLKSYGGIRVSEICVSVKGHLDFAFLWLKFACVWQNLRRTCLIFNFVLPIWWNCALALF